MEYYRLTYRDFYLMQQGWSENDEVDWEKVRLLIFFLIKINGSKVQSPDSIMTLPSIDGDKKDYFERIKEKILNERKLRNSPTK